MAMYGYLDNMASAESRGNIRRLVSSGVKRSEQKRIKLAIPTETNKTMHELHTSHTRSGRLTLVPLVQ